MAKAPHRHLGFGRDDPRGVIAALDAYQRAGGQYREEVLADCGHSPHVEKEDETEGIGDALHFLMNEDD